MTLSKLFLSSALGLILLAQAAQSAQADSIIVALPPSGDQDVKRAEAIDALKLVTSVTQPGESSPIINGQTGGSICTFTVPPKKSYASDKAKLNYNGACAATVMEQASAPMDSVVPGSLDISGTLRSIVSNYDMSETDAIVVFGSPIYHDPKEPDLSMKDGHVASDGHISAPATDSHLGMKGLEDALDGTPVHFAHQGYEWAQNTRHEASVERFIALTVNYLGGELVTFNADRGQTIERVKRGVSNPVKKFEMSESDKLEMLFVGFDPRTAPPIHERELSTAPVRQSETRLVGNVEVGITWDCACDLDIHVKANANAKPLYYGRKATREGRFFKDYRSSSDLLNGLESVSFSAPVNLDDVIIGANFYGGKAPSGVSGEIRLSVNGRTYAKAFEIKATRGNIGWGGAKAMDSGQAPNAAWVVVKGIDVVRPHLRGE